MKVFKIFGLSSLICASLTLPGLANNDYDYQEPQTYAQDKLVNAQAQLERLKAQKRAINKLMRAIKKDLKAARIRSKAEKIQLSANNAKQDATIMVEQAGVAVDLPDLMAAKGVEAGLLENTDKKKDIDLMFKDKEAQESVFFPAGSEGAGIKNDADLPSYIK